MPNIVLTKIKEPDYDKVQKAKILTFLIKLRQDDSIPGLHIEPMQHPADSRARTGRVDQSLRAVLYRLDTDDSETVYVYAGTWPHDEAIHRARTRKLNVNPVNGVAELIEATAPSEQPVAAPEVPAVPPQVAAEAATPPVLQQFGYALDDLLGLGFDDSDAARILAASDEDELLALAESFERPWQASAVLGLATGDPIEKIAADLALERETVVDTGADEDQRFLESLKHPASQMQFTLVDSDEELRRVIEGGDFGAWRVFLHPEQRRYVTQSYNGPFRLTGGAGTGKTVVLIHRARELHRRRPDARIVLTTFTKALAGNLERDLQRLDPDVTRATGIGRPGVLIRGIDALASSVREQAGSGFYDAALVVFGESIETFSGVHNAREAWKEAIEDVDPSLPESLLTPTFFEAEYLQVILPNRIHDFDGYATVRRPGRGVALDRAKRAAVWKVVARYRKNARLFGRLSFAEIAEIGAAWLETAGPAARLADHVLIDEGQDLVPSHWRLLRALVPEGADDLFVAEDTHQRIYGAPIVLSRYGVKIVGRSRRLTLNYRTTEQTLRWAMRVLEGAKYVDSEEEIEGVAGYRSARRGSGPRRAER